MDALLGLRAGGTLHCVPRRLSCKFISFGVYSTLELCHTIVGAPLAAGLGGRGGGVRGGAAQEAGAGGSLPSRARCVSRRLSRKSADKDNYLLIFLLRGSLFTLL